MAFDDMSTEELESLKDMFSHTPKDKALLESALDQSRKKALGETFGKTAAQNIVDQASIPGKSAIESAETLLPKNVTPMERALVPVETVATKEAPLAFKTAADVAAEAVPIAEKVAPKVGNKLLSTFGEGAVKLARAAPFIGTLTNAGFTAKDAYDMYDKYQKTGRVDNKDAAILLADVVGMVPGVGTATRLGAAALSTAGEFLPDDFLGSNTIKNIPQKYNQHSPSDNLSDVIPDNKSNLPDYLTDVPKKSPIAIPTDQDEEQTQSTQKAPISQSPLSKIQKTVSQTPSAPQDIVSPLQRIQQSLGYGATMSDAALQDALLKRQETAANANLAEALAGMGAAIGGMGTRSIIKTDTAPYEAGTKLAEQNVHDIQSARTAAEESRAYAQKQAEFAQQAQMMDDKSPMSIFAQNAVKKYFPNIDVKGMSAYDLQKNPVIAKMIEAAEAQKNRAAQMAMTQAMMGRKLDQGDTRIALNMNKSIVQDKQVLNLTSAKDRADEVLMALENTGKVPRQMLTEAAAAMAVIAAGKANIPHQLIKEMEINTIRTKLANAAQFGSGEIVDLKGTPEYNYLQSALKRMRDNTDQIINKRMDYLAQTNEAIAKGNQKAEAVVGQYKQPQQISNTVQPNEERRRTSDGKVAIFDSNTKKFLRYE